MSDVTRLLSAAASGNPRAAEQSLPHSSEPLPGQPMATDTPPDPPGSLQRKTNWWGAFVIGLAGTLLVTGIAPYAVKGMGAAAIPVFFVVTSAGVVLCLCLAELAAMMPHRTGGLPSYAAETYKDFGPDVARQVGGLSAWAYGLGWFPVAPINMILAARYIALLCGLPLGEEFTPISAPITLTVLLLALTGLFILFVPCYLGIQLGTSFATVLGVVSMVPITLLVFLPFFVPATMHWENVRGFPPADPAKADFTFYTSWVFIMTWSVLAMEAAACYIGECRDPARDAMIAMTSSGLYGLFIYVTLPLMLVVVLGNQTDADPLIAFLAYTEAIFGAGTWVRWVIGIPLILALMLSVLNALMGCGRSLYQAAHDGLLPKVFQHTNRHGAPDYAMAFNLVCSAGVVFLASPLEIYIVSNMGYLLSLGLALFGYFLYRQGHPDVPRPVRMPGFLRYVALGISVVFLFVWIYGGYHASDIAVGPGKRWLFFLGLGILLLYLPLYAYRRYVEDGGAVDAAVSREEVKEDGRTPGPLPDARDHPR
jgi:amino acid transporter